MLKEVGASGQISLGKKYAGQLFDMQFLQDGTVQLTPVKVVPVVQEELAAYSAGDGGLTPERLAQRKAAAARTPAQPEPGPQATKEWAESHAAEIEQYNAWASQREPYSQRVRRWREHGV